MIKAVSFLVLFITVIGVLGEEDDGQARQKRLLFYDEDGNLVKTYMNPYLQQLRLNPGNLPYYGNLINPFFAFLREFGNSLASLIVPVSNQVIEQIKKDPQYQNTLVLIPKKDPIVQPNTLCEGQRTQIPSPKFCNSYLNCWDGWAVEQECPAGLLFSKLGYCDYSDNVNCESRQLSPQIPTQPQCNKDFDSFRSRQNCNEFFVCVSRQPVPFKCPADLAYSEVLGVCDYPSRVDCSSSGQFTIPPAIPSKPVSDASPSPPIPSAPIVNPSTYPFPISPNPGSILPPNPESILPPNPGSILPPNWPISQRPIQLEDDPKTNIKAVITENSIVNSQSWTSTQVAMSRQDAIRQLQHGSTDNAPQLP